MKQIKHIIHIAALLLATVPTWGLRAQQQPAAWREVFTDPTLQTLIAEALENNSDVRTAELNVEQASALLSTARLSYLPTLALAPSGTLQKIGSQSWTKAYSLPATMAWEVNLRGRQSAQKRMARAQWMQSESLLTYTRLQLIASTANAYYTLLMLDRQVCITRQSVANQADLLDVMRTLKEVGQQNEAAVNQTEASYQSTLASLSDLELQVEKVESSLSLLLNRQPAPIERASWDAALGVILDDEQPVSLEALSARPDVRSAEYELRAALSNVTVARSAFYPTFSLSASAGWTNNLGQIINPAELLLQAIGSLTQPLFARGANRANLKVAKAQREQAEIAFEKALLTAGAEVKDALAECRTARQKDEARRLQVEASQKAYDNSVELMRHSSSTYLEVLTAQSAHLAAQLQQTADWMELQQGRISLYKALCVGVEE